MLTPAELAERCPLAYLTSGEVFPARGLHEQGILENCDLIRRKQRRQTWGDLAGLLLELQSHIDLDTGYWVVRMSEIEALAAALEEASKEAT